MKQRYERPVMYIEEFAVNRAIAGCGQKDVVFDCMMGPNTDTRNVITSSSSCVNIAGITKAKTATHLATQRSGHSSNSSGTWTGGNRSTLTYEAPEGSEGLLYICALEENGGGHGGNSGGVTFTTNMWTDNGNVLTHADDHYGQWHCQIAPIVSESDVIVGS